MNANDSGNAPSNLVALGEAARILHCSQELTRRLADAGTLHAIRLGNGQRIFHRSDVERVARERLARRRGGELAR